MANSSPQQPRTAASRLRRYFATGLLVLAPLWLTIYIIVLVVRLLGGFLSPYFRLAAYSLLGTEQWAGAVKTLADITAFLVTVIAITLIGMLVQRVIGKRLLKLLERLVGRIPVVRELYDSIRKFTEIFFGDKTSFQRVVAVHFPSDTAWTIGFVTGETKLNPDPSSDRTLLMIFVPTVPTPTSGFMLLAREEDVVPLDLTIDEAIKLVISGGTLSPERYMPKP